MIPHLIDNGAQLHIDGLTIPSKLKSRIREAFTAVPPYLHTWLIFSSSTAGLIAHWLTSIGQLFMKLQAGSIPSRYTSPSLATTFYQHLDGPTNTIHW
jgi:hypothetical protein